MQFQFQPISSRRNNRKRTRGRKTQYVIIGRDPVRNKVFTRLIRH